VAAEVFRIVQDPEGTLLKPRVGFAQQANADVLDPGISDGLQDGLEDGELVRRLFPLLLGDAGQRSAERNLEQGFSLARDGVWTATEANGTWTLNEGDCAGWTSTWPTATT
jgi:hypothetical protein